MTDYGFDQEDIDEREPREWDEGEDQRNFPASETQSRVYARDWQREQDRYDRGIYDPPGLP